MNERVDPPVALESQNPGIRVLLRFHDAATKSGPGGALAGGGLLFVFIMCLITRVVCLNVGQVPQAVQTGQVVLRKSGGATLRRVRAVLLYLLSSGLLEALGYAIIDRLHHLDLIIPTKNRPVGGCTLTLLERQRGRRRRRKRGGGRWRRLRGGCERK
ncbi:hypothetical protein KM043_007158 [Ampulex compressa]|nr:hypothetical protein KM043_007158 [Ampulex compressa]